MVKEYLAHGMGVNSTAMMLMLWDKGIKFESVFVDHGGDYPFAYDYCEYLKKQGFKITVLKPEVSRCNTIEEYCLKYGIIPWFGMRFCTQKFKVQPMHNYFDKPCRCYIGIDYGEQKRIKRIRFKNNIENVYPLIEEEINRDACIDLIKQYGLKVPNRTGCWLCPFMKKIDVRLLYLNYPDLYKRRKKIEDSCIKENFYFSQGKPMDVVAMVNIPDICKNEG